jgi:hypothetical protein
MESDRHEPLVHYNEYVAGWLDSSIHDFLGAFPWNSESAAYALITCLDSHTEPASLLRRSAAFRALAAGSTPLQGGLLLPTKLLHKESLRSKLFVGFDEIWFFPTNKVEPKPLSASIVGPRRLDHEALTALGYWMGANGCSLALGDGAGLNVIVKAHGLTKYVIAHSMAQPEPTFQMSDLWVQDEDKSPATARPRKDRH